MYLNFSQEDYGKFSRILSQAVIMDTNPKKYTIYWACAKMAEKFLKNILSEKSK